jgi:hypothetical protein
MAKTFTLDPAQLKDFEPVSAGIPAGPGAPRRFTLDPAQLKDFEPVVPPSAPAPPAADEEPSKWASLGRGLLQGATFGLADEISGRVEAMFSDKTYEQARDESRAAFKKAEEAHGGYYLGGQIGGGIASSLIPGGIVGKAAARLGVSAAAKTAAALGDLSGTAATLTRAERAAQAINKAAAWGRSNPLKAAAIVGGSQGAAAGYGESEAEGLGGQATDALTGGVVGAAAGYGLTKGAAALGARADRIGREKLMKYIQKLYGVELDDQTRKLVAEVGPEEVKRMGLEDMKLKPGMKAKDKLSQVLPERENLQRTFAESTVASDKKLNEVGGVLRVEVTKVLEEARERVAGNADAEKAIEVLLRKHGARPQEAGTAKTIAMGGDVDMDKQVDAAIKALTKGGLPEDMADEVARRAAAAGGGEQALNAAVRSYNDSVLAGAQAVYAGLPVGSASTALAGVKSAIAQARRIGGQSGGAKVASALEGLLATASKRAPESLSDLEVAGRLLGGNKRALQEAAGKIAKEADSEITSVVQKHDLRGLVGKPATEQLSDIERVAQAVGKQYEEAGQAIYKAADDGKVYITLRDRRGETSGEFRLMHEMLDSWDNPALLPKELKPFRDRLDRISRAKKGDPDEALLFDAAGNTLVSKADDAAEYGLRTVTLPDGSIATPLSEWDKFTRVLGSAVYGSGAGHIRSVGGTPVKIARDFWRQARKHSDDAIDRVAQLGAADGAQVAAFKELRNEYHWLSNFRQATFARTEPELGKAGKRAARYVPDMDNEFSPQMISQAAAGLKPEQRGLFYQILGNNLGDQSRLVDAARVGDMQDQLRRFKSDKALRAYRRAQGKAAVARQPKEELSPMMRAAELRQVTRGIEKLDGIGASSARDLATERLGAVYDGVAERKFKLIDAIEKSMRAKEANVAAPALRQAEQVPPALRNLSYALTPASLAMRAATAVPEAMFRAGRFGFDEALVRLVPLVRRGASRDAILTQATRMGLEGAAARAVADRALQVAGASQGAQ